MTATGIKLKYDVRLAIFTIRNCPATDIASDTMAKMYRGTFSKMGAMAMKLVPKVYIVGAAALGTDSATRTVKNFPKPPVGASTAEMSPPTFSPPSKPADQAGTEAADAVKAAPKKCGIIYRNAMSEEWIL